jgi:hypothetical protein
MLLTEVNEIGWKLCMLNPDLIGKRGLLQRAVDRSFILTLVSETGFRRRSLVVSLE